MEIVNGNILIKFQISYFTFQISPKASMIFQGGDRPLVALVGVDNTLESFKV